MDGSALRGDTGPEPGWGDVRRAVMMAAEICATAAVSLAVRGPHAVHAAMMVRQSADALRDMGGCLRPLAFDEAVIDAERARAADEALGAAGLLPPPRRHLRVVT
jgi:hypothetical protein